ncbi:MAG: energy-coupling factor transporter transmembrane protein EcfT [Clostridia bacterium]|nr:energy-coupling factor transporter transmembrane protein EcfT [Clostridia bacterium]
MRRFHEHNPIAVTAYFLCASGVAMMCMDPLLLLTALAGALCCHGLMCAPGSARTHLFSLGLFAVMTLVNPLLSHNGATVLFVMNHNPVTLEALLYGAAAAGMVTAVMYFFRAFSHVMTSDRLLYVFGGLSPKLALVLSMALRYVPLFGQQTRKVRQTQQALGLFREDNIIDGLRGEARVFSVMTTWALENGVITADSMTARGYGTGRRTRFRLFRWTARDTLLLCLTLVLTGLTLWGAAGRGFTWYPRITAPPMTTQAAAGYAAYGLLALLPVLYEGKEAIRWRCLMSGM